jgi:hypothetical protein
MMPDPELLRRALTPELYARSRLVVLDASSLVSDLRAICAYSQEMIRYCKAAREHGECPRFERSWRM